MGVYWTLSSSDQPIELTMLALIGVLMIFLLAQLVIKPYATDSLNRIETVSLVCLLLLLVSELALAGLTHYTEDDEDGSSATEFLIQGILGVLPSIAFYLIFVKVLRHELM